MKLIDKNFSQSIEHYKSSTGKIIEAKVLSYKENDRIYSVVDTKELGVFFKVDGKYTLQTPYHVAITEHFRKVIP